MGTKISRYVVKIWMMGISVEKGDDQKGEIFFLDRGIIPPCPLHYDT